MNRGLRRQKTIIVECKVCHAQIEALTMARITKMVANHYFDHHPGVNVPPTGSVRAPLRTAVPAKAVRSARSSRSGKSGQHVKNPRAGKAVKASALWLMLDERQDRLSRLLSVERERLDHVCVAVARVERLIQTIDQQRHPNTLPIVVQEREEARSIVRRWVRLCRDSQVPVPEFVRTLSESWLSVRPGLTRSELRS